MEYNLFLDKTENTRNVEQEEKNKFIRYVLENLEIPLDFWPDEDKSMTIDQKIHFRNLMDKLQISIIEDPEGGVEVIIDNNTIAEWRKPYYTLKADYSIKDPKKRHFLEMKVSFWSVFEQQES